MATPSRRIFSDGISEDIITDLSKLSELHVIARNSSFIYKHKAVLVPEVARDLGVRYVLEGSVRKAANRIRVTAQLINSVTGGHVWANRFDRELTDIFDAKEDELTREIVSALKLNLTSGERDRLVRRRAASVEAYELLLRSREQTMLLTRGSNIAARSLAEAAIAIDPNYATAYALIAFTYLNDYANGYGGEPGASLRVGRELAERAASMDDENPACHLALGAAYSWSRDLDRRGRAGAAGARTLTELRGAHDPVGRGPDLCRAVRPSAHDSRRFDAPRPALSRHRPPVPR